MTYFQERAIPSDYQYHLEPEYVRFVEQRSLEDHHLVDCYFETDYNPEMTKKIIRFKLKADKNTSLFQEQNPDPSSNLLFQCFDYTRSHTEQIRRVKHSYKKRIMPQEAQERLARLRAKPFGQAALVSTEENGGFTTKMEKEVFIEPPDKKEGYFAKNNLYATRTHRIISSTLDETTPIPDTSHYRFKSKLSASASKKEGEAKYIPPSKRQRQVEGGGGGGEGESVESKLSQKYVPPSKRKSNPTSIDGKPTKSTTSLRIQNLASDMDRYELLDLFRPYGRVRKLHIVKNSQGDSQYAFVHYDFNEEAQTALDTLHQRPIPGRGVVLSLEWANNRG